MNNLIEDNSNTAMLSEAMLPASTIYQNVVIIRDEAVFNIIYHNKTSGVITVATGDQLWLLQDVEECVLCTFDNDDHADLAQVLCLEEFEGWDDEKEDYEFHDDLIHTGITLEETIGDYNNPIQNPEYVRTEVYTLPYEDLMNASACGEIDPKPWVVVHFGQYEEFESSFATKEEAIASLRMHQGDADDMQWASPILAHPTNGNSQYDLASESWVY